MPEKQAKGKPMQCNRDKCRVLCQGRKTPGSNRGLSAEKHQGLVSASKPERSPQCALSAETAASSLDCVNKEPSQLIRGGDHSHWPAPIGPRQDTALPVQGEH